MSIIPCTHTSSFVCGLWTSMLSRVVLCRYASLVVCDFWAASTAACCYRNCYKICLLFTATVAATAAAKKIAANTPRPCLDHAKMEKSFQDSPSHRICRYIYGTLNVGKKITNYTVCL
jgi:hypothetical protein